MEAFTNSTGFCPTCGSIFPTLKARSITCYSCKNTFEPKDLPNEVIEYEIHFNTYNSDKFKKFKKEENNEPEGPVVERKCSACGHGKMSYATLQLRSVDEGQTVFFTCLKCKYKESENS